MGMGDGWTDMESIVAASCTSAMGYGAVLLVLLQMSDDGDEKKDVVQLYWCGGCGWAVRWKNRMTSS
jgi:hypothetical protein